MTAKAITFSPDDCIRYENGMLATKECKKQFETQLKTLCRESVIAVSLPVDRERGIGASPSAFSIMCRSIGLAAGGAVLKSRRETITPH